MRRWPKRRGAAPRQGERPAYGNLPRAAEGSDPPIRPELHELARVCRQADLHAVRWQVSPGDRVAIYLRAGREARLLIIGPGRRHVDAPLRLESEWRLAGEVLICDDREESLPGRYIVA